MTEMAEEQIDTILKGIKKLEENYYVPLYMLKSKGEYLLINLIKFGGISYERALQDLENMKKQYKPKFKKI